MSASVTPEFAVDILHNDDFTLQDQLSRGGLRSRLGTTLAQCQPPHVFGLHGEWGSGKTSFLRQLYCELDEAALKTLQGSGKSLEDVTGNSYGNHVIAVWFEAWRYQAEAQPVVALLQEIRRALEQRSFKKRMGEKAKKLAEISARSILGGIDDAIKLLKLESLSTKGVQAAGEAWEQTHLQTRLGTDTVREFLEQAINSLLEWKAPSTGNTPRVIVFIDDIDRCQPATAFRLLEALKIHLALPNCIFVLGMNQQIVVEAIASELKRDEKDGATQLKAEAYLEKLCTSIWRLPLPDREQVKAFFTGLLADEALKPRMVALLGAQSCLPPNPRKLKAMANMTNRLWSALSPEQQARQDIEYAVLVYAYIYQFHGDLFRRWQWDRDFISQIANFVRGELSAAGSPQPSFASCFSGLILPIETGPDFGENSGVISTFPDPSMAGIFWIAPLLQRGAAFGDASPDDFECLFGTGV